MNTDSACVYYVFDDYGLLLYIGCSSDVARRMVQHNSSPWARHRSHLDVSGPFDRDSALALEAAEIRDKRPFFNAQPEHTAMVQANRVAATRLLDSLDIKTPEGDHDEWHEAWYRARNAIAYLIRDRYPVIDDETRTQVYLAARRRRSELVA